MEWLQKIVAFLNRPKRMQHLRIGIHNSNPLKAQYERIKQDNIRWFNMKMERETKVYMELKKLLQDQHKQMNAVILKNIPLSNDSLEKEHTPMNTIPRFVIASTYFAVGCILFWRHNYM